MFLIWANLFFYKDSYVLKIINIVISSLFYVFRYTSETNSFFYHCFGKKYAIKAIFNGAYERGGGERFNVNHQF